MVRAFSLKSKQNSTSSWAERSTFNNDGDIVGRICNEIILINFWSKE